MAYDEARRELDVQRFEALPLDQPCEQADGGSAHLRQGLADGGEHRGDDGRVLDVVEADHREVLRHPQPTRAGGTEGADRMVVVEREDRRRRLRQVEEQIRRLLTAVDLEVRLHLELGIGEDARRRERGVVAAPAILGGDPAVRTGDDRDPPVAEREQVTHRLVGARRVRGRDGRDALVERHQRVDDDEAVARVDEPLELVARLLREHDQRAVGEPVHQPVEERHLTVVLVAGG